MGQARPGQAMPDQPATDMLHQNPEQKMDTQRQRGSIEFPHQKNMFE